MPVSRSSVVAFGVAAGQDLFLSSMQAKLTQPPLPTAAQLQMMDMGLSLFVHFSVNPWSSIEHNCVGESPECIPSEAFNPSNLSTDQWVEAAAAMGAGEVCLTAHHEGGFCLWDTKYSDYSVMQSPYGQDVVQEFVDSCKKYGVKPCFYMGPNANGYLANNQSYSAAAFVEAQLGMLEELLTKYGQDYVSRLWWDHYPGNCGGLAPCPEGSFPDAWPQFVQLVREVSPSTIICPGPDCDGHQGESGLGQYPMWLPCTPSEANGTVLRCSNHGASADLVGFHPYETCATMHNGWFCKGSGEGGTNKYWSARDIWDHYMASVGIGYVNTLNAPPGTTGRIPDTLVENMRTFGEALKDLLEPISSSAVVQDVELQCSTEAQGVELDLGEARKFNALMLREDLSKGQRIQEYDIDFLNDQGKWVTFDRLTVAYPFSLDQGQCGDVQNNLNLVSGGPSSSHVVALTDNATACKALCEADTKCNTWTWHDESLSGYAKKCFVRYDTCYEQRQESGHFGGACNHTLPSSQSECGGIPASGTGVHGHSVGARVIDFVSEMTSSKLRFRCLSSLVSDGSAYLKSFSVHMGNPPLA